MSELIVLYDGQCPLCRRVATLNRLRDNYAGINLIDARNSPELVAAYRGRGYDINDGIIIEEPDGPIHGGVDAMAFIAAAEDGRRRSLLVLPFLSKSFGKRAYPVLTLGRRVLLKLLGRSTKIS